MASRYTDTEYDAMRAHEAAFEICRERAFCKAFVGNSVFDKKKRELCWMNEGEMPNGRPTDRTQCPLLLIKRCCDRIVQRERGFIKDTSKEAGNAKADGERK